MRNTESEEFSFWYKNRILICTDYGKIYCNIEYNDIDTKFYIPDYNYRFYIREQNIQYAIEVIEKYLVNDLLYDYQPSRDFSWYNSCHIAQRLIQEIEEKPKIEVKQNNGYQWLSIKYDTVNEQQLTSIIEKNFPHDMTSRYNIFEKAIVIWLNQTQIKNIPKLEQLPDFLFICPHFENKVYNKNYNLTIRHYDEIILEKLQLQFFKQSK